VLDGRRRLERATRREARKSARRSTLRAHGSGKSVEWQRAS